MEDFLQENHELEQSNESEYSESDVCSSSCYTSDSEYAPWLDHVKSDGSLFYIEKDTNLDQLFSESFHESHQSEESHSQQSKSKFSLAEKIKKWMKTRKKKGWKSFPLTESNKSENTLYSFQNEDQFTFPQSKDIFVDVDVVKVSSCNNSELSLAEMLFGIKLGSMEETYSACDKPCILSIRPNENIPDVKIGDKILSVNDIIVNMSNFEDVLKGITVPSKVKLTILLFKSQAHSQLPKHYDLISELLDETTSYQHVKSQCQSIPHCLFFLTIDYETFENDDVIYRYPDDDTLLFQLKGMFLTLGSIISDVATPPLLSCSVMVSGDIVNVGYVTEGDNVMILALPASVASVIEVQHFSIGISKIFKYLFSSLQNTFTMENNEDFLDKFCTLYFEHYLYPVSSSQNIASEPHLIDILPSTHWFPLPSDIQTEIDDILSDLESADFGIGSDGFYKNRRLYNIFGSCLFYKGYLLSSHLPKSDLLDVHSFLHYNHLLELTRTQPDTQIIIWRKVFPSKYQNCFNPDPEFQEFHGQWFILVLVMHHSILAVLLDDSENCIKHGEYPLPEPFYVEEVQNTLWILHDCGITSAVENMLHFSVFPPAASNLLYKNNSESSLASAFTSNTSIPSSGPNVSDNSTSHSSLTEKNQAHGDGESDSGSSYSNDSSEVTSIQTRYRSLSISAGYLSKSELRCDQSEYDADRDEHGKNSSSLPNLYNAEIKTDSICFENSFRMAYSFGTNLFCYLHMDPVEGIFIAPIVCNFALPESLPKCVLDNFYRSCLHMRTVFERSLRNGEITKADITTKYGVNRFLQNAYEQGLLLKCDKINSSKQKSSQNSDNFWVIGRIFFSPEPREVYVCHQDGAAQDVVEMAFRLGFGLSL